jgi:hypothetical protein
MSFEDMLCFTRARRNLSGVEVTKPTLSCLPPSPLHLKSPIKTQKWSEVLYLKSKNNADTFSLIPILYLTVPNDLQTLAVDLLNPSLEAEKSRHKLKRLVQSPNSYFMDVKCPGK